MTVGPQLDVSESLLIIGLIGLILSELRQALRSRAWVAIYRPTLFVAGIFAYYVLIGPLWALSGESGAIYRGLNHRPLLLWGWLGALVSYASLLLGFYASPRQHPPRRLILHADPERMHRVGLRLCLIGLVMFALVTGVRVVAMLNPLSAGQWINEGLGESGIDVGSVYNYFSYAVNLLIPGLVMMAAAWLRSRRHGLSFLIWLLSAAAIYISLGFRYRLVLLTIPLLLLWFMARRRRPSLSLLSLFLVIFIAGNGLIGLTRSYGRGLNLSIIEDRGVSDFFDAGFQESAVFLTSAGIIDQTPSRAPYVGSAPLIATLLSPVPRALYPDKPDAGYISDAIVRLYGSLQYAQGAAFLNYAEYYLVAGWPSLIAFSFLLGWLLRRLWNWFLFRQNEPFAQALYLLSASYLYVVISRGYLPQVVMLFAFSVAPLFLLYGRWARPVLHRGFASAPPLPRS